MKQILLLLFAIAFVGCSGDDSKTEVADTNTLRNRNLALAYIDSGMMKEASEKLALLEESVPWEAFIYANQGLVALRQNNLEEANTLLEKANDLSPNNPEVALLRGEVAMLTGQFEQSTQILEYAINANPDNMHLRWARNDSKEHLQVIVDALPKNIVARLAYIKELLKADQFNKARDHLLVLQKQGVVQDEQAMGLFNGALMQIDNEKARVARAQVIGLDNVLKPTRAWQHSLLEVAGAPGTVGHPIRQFINTAIPDWNQPRAKQVSFTKDAESLLPAGKKRVLLVESPTQSTLVTMSDGYTFVTASVDWNNDRKLDVIGGTTNGRVYVEGGETLLEENGSVVQKITPWDADQDGDLDLLVTRGETLLLQNNGDETVTIRSLDTPVLRSTHIIDIDEDGAVDVVGIDEDGFLVLLKNERSGNIHAVHNLLPNICMADLTVADFNNDGWMDIAYLSYGKAYVAENTTKSNPADRFSTREIGGFGFKIDTADFDNDTRQDIIVGGKAFEILFANGKTATIPAIGSLQLIDADLDGDLDIVTNGTEYAIWYQDGTPSENEFQKVILEAILEGGQRNNSLAVGGFVEVISGGTYQKHLVTGPMTHIGLGGKPADAIRVVWPNGVPQEVIEPTPNQVFTEVQILKGSCPFLATSNDDGSWEFVTDLLWRSPLGLKINAQTVPPIAATQDWVKVRSDQLRARDGIYELAVTAQLWETHFFDEIKMVAIDHPIGTEIFVDERFVAPVPPQYKLYVYDDVQEPVGAVDQDGKDVLEVIRGRDGNRLGGFAKGRYQGIGEDHYVELDLGWNGTLSGIDLIAQGWIRPTDTSINVASSQGSAPPPKALEISVPDGKGGWKIVIPNGGFPAGKLKTIILEIPSGSFVGGDNRVRIATNLEIYWDRLAFATKSRTKTQTTPIKLLTADLGYMGYPAMSRTDVVSPNIPDYTDIQLGNVWRDLEGFYTRYGAVEELLSGVDDRYVIMNAGDAMYLQFEEPKQKIADGFVRDFIFFCDGWVKDGDWNTVASRTVGPLPFHTMSGYPYLEDERPAELLPSHSDWQEFHTRYITPAPFRDALK
jgi:tetratricopeptide (TPR) repeat protein